MGPLAGTPGRAVPRRVFVYPWATNPYQASLYGALRDAFPGFRVTSLRWSSAGVALFVPRLLMERARRTEIVHLHWPVLVPATLGRRFPRLALAYARGCVRLPQRLGMRLVWTMHNLAPHEEQFPGEAALTADIVRLADATIVHSSSAIDELGALGLVPRRVEVIALGVSTPLRPSSDRTAVLGSLGLGAQDRLFLFFGLLRPYKGVEELVEAFRLVERPGTHLLVVGECLDESLRVRIDAAADGDAHITVATGRISEQRLADLLSVADYVCLPFRAVTTSSSAITALSYGVPLIAPRLGDLVQIDPGYGYLYLPTDPDGLRRALGAAVADGDSHAAHAAALRRSFHPNTWDEAARLTGTLYETLLRS